VSGSLWTCSLSWQLNGLHLNALLSEELRPNLNFLLVSPTIPVDCLHHLVILKFQPRPWRRRQILLFRRLIIIFVLWCRLWWISQNCILLTSR
jgi:hypothetical protein